ncbi:MAG: phage integrase N-terminal SAM-like domain-containing protein [Bryobacteraceae bacterium]
MTDELVRRNYSAGTARAYLRSVQGFAEYFNRPPDQLGPEQIREYVAHLFEARQLSSSSVSQQVAALRFFYVKTFRKAWSVEDTPYPKRENRLPLILSVEEVSQLINAADTLYHRTLLMTAYGTGARRAEIVNLQIADIDHQVTFRWRDSQHHNQQRRMTLSVHEFLRRFLLHVLPIGFVRIRYSGLFAHRKRKELLPVCLKLLAASTPHRTAHAPTGAAPWLWACPICGEPMQLVERLTPLQARLRAPPEKENCR